MPDMICVCKLGARLDVHAPLLAVLLGHVVASEDPLHGAPGRLLRAQAQAAQDLVLGHAALACTPRKA